ncbi:MAG: hypothetical protein U7126_31940 [Microcoleus sp.]
MTTKYFGKNPVSEPHALRQETGFFTKSVGDNEVFRKKPGFWTYTPTRNRVFYQVCG